MADFNLINTNEFKLLQSKKFDLLNQKDDFDYVSFINGITKQPIKLEERLKAIVKQLKNQISIVSEEIKISIKYFFFLLSLIFQRNQVESRENGI